MAQHNTPPRQNSGKSSNHTSSQAEREFRMQVKAYYKEFRENLAFDENSPSKDDILKDNILTDEKVLVYRRNVGLAKYYHQYKDKAKGLMFNRSVPDFEQEEIYNDTWIKIYRQLTKEEHCPYEYQPYFMRILFYTCMDYFKQVKKMHWQDIDEKAMNEIPQPIGENEDMEFHYLLLLEAVENLEEPIQSAWKLHYYWLLKATEVERSLRKVKFGKLTEVLGSLHQIDNGFNLHFTQMKLYLSYTQDKDLVMAIFGDGLKTNIKKLQAFLGLEKEPRKNEIASLMTEARMKLDTYFYQDKEKGCVLVSDKDNTPVFLDTNGNILEALSDDNKQVFEHIVLDKAGKLVEIPALQTIRNSMGRNGAWTQRLIAACKKVIFGNRNL